MLVSCRLFARDIAIICTDTSFYFCIFCILGSNFYLIKLSFFSHILTPFGMWVGVKEKKFVQASPNSVLEMFYVKNGSSRTNNNTNDLEVHLSPVNSFFKRACTANQWG